MNGQMSRVIAGMFLGLSVALLSPTASHAAGLPGAVVGTTDTRLTPFEQAALVAKIEAQVRAGLPTDAASRDAVDMVMAVTHRCLVMAASVPDATEQSMSQTCVEVIPMVLNAIDGTRHDDAGAQMAIDASHRAAVLAAGNDPSDQTQTQAAPQTTTTTSTLLSSPVEEPQNNGSPGDANNLSNQPKNDDKKDEKPSNSSSSSHHNK